MNELYEFIENSRVSINYSTLLALPRSSNFLPRDQKEIRVSLAPRGFRSRFYSAPFSVSTPFFGETAKTTESVSVLQRDSRKIGVQLTSLTNHVLSNLVNKSAFVHVRARANVSMLRLIKIVAYGGAADGGPGTGDLFADHEPAIIAIWWRDEAAGGARMRFREDESRYRRRRDSGTGGARAARVYTVPYDAGYLDEEARVRPGSLRLNTLAREAANSGAERGAGNFTSRRNCAGENLP